MSIENCRSTRGASKQRRDQINIEIQNLRELLPLADSVKERLFQLQVMSLTCVLIRKHLHFGTPELNRSIDDGTLRHVNVCKTISSGFLLAVTRNGKLLAVSENVSDYLGLLPDELMCQGDSLFDLVDSRDHFSVWTILNLLKPVQKARTDRNKNRISSTKDRQHHEANSDERRAFVCRWNQSRMAKRFASHSKYMLIEGRFFSLAQGKDQNTKQNEEMATFGALCRPLLTPENADLIVSGNDPCVFRMVLSMEFVLISADKMAMDYLEFQNVSGDCDPPKTVNFYHHIHPSDVQIIASKHRLLLGHQLAVPAAVMCQFRLTAKSGEFQWFQGVFIRCNEDPIDELELDKDQTPKSVIYLTLQILSEAEVKAIHDAYWLNASENPTCTKKTTLPENKTLKVNLTLHQNTNPPVVTRQCTQSQFGWWPDFNFYQMPHVDLNNNSSSNFANSNKCATNTALNALNWMMVFGEKGNFGHFHPQTTPNFADFHMRQNHLAASAEKCWKNGEWAAGLMENLEQMHFFSLPELDNRDLDEFFRQVEEATEGRHKETNDSRDIKDVGEDQTQPKCESSAIIARLKERLARKRKSLVDANDAISGVKREVRGRAIESGIPEDSDHRSLGDSEVIDSSSFKGKTDTAVEYNDIANKTGQ